MTLPDIAVDSFSCFKAYDVRGRIPDQLNEDIAYRIGRAYAAFLQPKTVVVGYDIRLSSQSICGALSNGLMDSGVNVFNIGLCGTEDPHFVGGQGGLSNCAARVDRPGATGVGRGAEGLG